MTPRLDRSKSFGEIIPSGGYYQDGHYFDVQGTYLRSDGVAPATEPKSVPKAEKPKATEPADIDLAAWAKGEKNYVFFSVVKAVKEQFPDATDIGKKADVLAFLIAKGVVSENEAVR